MQHRNIDSIPNKIACKMFQRDVSISFEYVILFNGLFIVVVSLIPTIHRNKVQQKHSLICNVYCRWLSGKQMLIKLATRNIWQQECGTWYHHPWRPRCVLSRNLRIFKVSTWHFRCNFVYYSAAKFTFQIEQPSNKATKCGIRRSWKLKVKPNLGCCSIIAITISYISVFVSSW